MKKIGLSLAMILVLTLGVLPGATSAAGVSSLFTVYTKPAATMPPSAIVAVGDNGTDNVTFTAIDIWVTGESVFVNSMVVTRQDGTDSDFKSVSVWDSDMQIGANLHLVDGNATLNLPPDRNWFIAENVTKRLTIRANLSGMQNGAVSGNAPRLSLDTISGVGAISGQSFIAAVDTSGKPMVLRKSKPIIAAASLPTTALSAGEKVPYRWTVTVDQKGDISWRNTMLVIAGSIQIGEEKFTIGEKTEVSTPADAIYMQSANGTLKKLIPIESLRISNVETGEQIQGTFLISNSPDKALISFTAREISTGIRGDVNGDGQVNALDITKLERIIAGLDREEQNIPAGQTKTYELRGTLLYDGKAGDAIMTRIPAGGGLDSVFTWNDGIAWATDYLVPGLPTATLSLSK